MSETQGQKVVCGGGIVIIYFGELPILGEIMPIGGQIPFFCLKEHPCIGEKILDSLQCQECTRGKDYKNCQIIAKSL